ncbi:hypothetical protein bcgnr5390_17730 [Bacillus luti]|nr:hypothetical protein BC2903_61900 [Bacillus cereus]
MKELSHIRKQFWGNLPFLQRNWKNEFNVGLPLSTAHRNVSPLLNTDLLHKFSEIAEQQVEILFSQSEWMVTDQLGCLLYGDVWQGGDFEELLHRELQFQEHYFKFFLIFGKEISNLAWNRVRDLIEDNSFFEPFIEEFQQRMN